MMVETFVGCTEGPGEASRPAVIASRSAPVGGAFHNIVSQGGHP